MKMKKFWALTMAKIQFLIILLVVTCFVGGVVSVTDKEIEVNIVFFATDLRKGLCDSYFAVYGLDRVRTTFMYLFTSSQTHFVSFSRIVSSRLIVSCSSCKKKTRCM